MDRQFPQVHWVVRPVVILLAVLVTLDLFLVGMALVGMPASPDYNERFAVEQQTHVLNTGADGVRQQWRQFQGHMETRARAARY